MSDHIPDVTKMIGETPRTDAISRINEYLCVGGFFNPEIVNVQQHEAVRDTLIQARDELNAANERIKNLESALCTVENIDKVNAYQDLESANERIKRLEESENRLLNWLTEDCPESVKKQLSNAWMKSKEAKP